MLIIKEMVQLSAGRLRVILAALFARKYGPLVSAVRILRRRNSLRDETGAAEIRRPAEIRSCAAEAD